MDDNKKTKLIKKHLGKLTPDWVIDNCINLLNEFEEIENKQESNITDKKLKFSNSDLVDYCNKNGYFVGEYWFPNKK